MHEIFCRKHQYSSLIPRNHFLKVREDSKKLSENNGELFHLVVAKILLVMEISKPDLGTAVIFLTTRVPKNNVDDWEKWRGILRFIHCILK